MSDKLVREEKDTRRERLRELKEKRNIKNKRDLDLSEMREAIALIMDVLKI